MVAYIECPVTYAEAAHLVQEYLHKQQVIGRIDTVRVKSEQCFEVTFEASFPEQKQLVYRVEQRECQDCWEVKESER